MDDKVIKAFFSSGRNNNIISPGNNLKKSIFISQPDYQANRYFTDKKLNFLADQVHLPDYRYTPPNLKNIPSQKFEQVKFNNFNSFDRKDIEVSNNRLAVIDF
jgi:hypothetical protein